MVAVSNDGTALFIANVVCTPLSILGAGYLIYHFHKNPERTFSAKLIVSVAYSDLLLSLVNIFNMLSDYSFFCNVEGFFLSTGIYSNVLWTIYILAILYFQFVKGIPNLQQYFNKMLFSNIMLSIFPGILTSISAIFHGPLFFGSYLGNCCIQPLEAYVYLMIIPFGILITLGCVLIVRVYIAMKALSETVANNESKTLFSFAAVLLFLYIPISVDYSLSQLFYPLTVFCLFTFKLVGFINAVQYRNSMRRKAELKVIADSTYEDDKNESFTES